MSLNARVLSLCTLFDPTLAADLAATLELRLGDDRFRAHVAGGRLEMLRGEAPGADATVTTGHGTLLALSHRRLELADALRAGDVKIEGDQALVERFLGLFTMPASAQPAPAAA